MTEPTTGARRAAEKHSGTTPCDALAEIIDRESGLRELAEASRSLLLALNILSHSYDEGAPWETDADALRTALAKVMEP